MTTHIPDRHEVKGAFKRLSKDDQEWVYWAADTGEPVPNPALAGITVAYARHRLRLGLVRDLPFYGGSALAGGVITYLVSDGSSAGFAFAFFLGLVGFVGHLWWWSTWRPRKRGLAVNQALLEGKEPPVKKRPSSDGSWAMAVPLAWVTTLAVTGVVHVTLGVGDLVGLPLFVVALVAYRRLLHRTNESIDEWGRRST